MIEDGSLAGFEALARWRHPERGLVPPSEFIDLGERCGLIRHIDLAIIAGACRLLREAVTNGATPFLSVNLSAQHFADFGVVKSLSKILADTGFDPAHLKVELTETALVQDPRKAHEVLTQIKALGVTIALDDFGTGYSSLSYLHSFPFDVLKIDQSFVRQLGSPGRTHDIVETIIMLANRMGMLVVAEGIETPDLIPPLQRAGLHLRPGLPLQPPGSGKRTCRTARPRRSLPRRLQSSGSPASPRSISDRKASTTCGSKCLPLSLFRCSIVSAACQASLYGRLCIRAS